MNYMKKEYRYSKKKFLGFSPDKQKKIIWQLLNDLFFLWDDPRERELLLATFNSCRSFGLDFLTGINEIPEKRELYYLMLNLEKSLNLNIDDRKILSHKSRLTIEKLDGEKQMESYLPVTVILDNLRSSFNVGSIFRTSECLRIEELILCGYTPAPDNKKVHETSMGTDKYVKWQHRANTIDAIKELRSSGYMIYALETCEGADDLFDVDFQYPIALLLGNEALGLDEEILNLVDKIVKINVRGWKNSLNVATAYAITAYDIFRKWESKSFNL